MEEPILAQTESLIPHLSPARNFVGKQISSVNPINTQNIHRQTTPEPRTPSNIEPPRASSAQMATNLAKLEESFFPEQQRFKMGINAVDHKFDNQQDFFNQTGDFSLKTDLLKDLQSISPVNSSPSLPNNNSQASNRGKGYHSSANTANEALNPNPNIAHHDYSQNLNSAIDRQENFEILSDAEFESTNLEELFTNTVKQSLYPFVENLLSTIAQPISLLSTPSKVNSQQRESGSTKGNFEDVKSKTIPYSEAKEYKVESKSEPKSESRTEPRIGFLNLGDYSTKYPSSLLVGYSHKDAGVCATEFRDAHLLVGTPSQHLIDQLPISNYQKLKKYLSLLKLHNRNIRAIYLEDFVSYLYQSLDNPRDLVYDFKL